MSNHKKTKNPESKFLDGNVQMCVYYRADGTSIIERKVHTSSSLCQGMLNVRSCLGSNKQK